MPGPTPTSASAPARAPIRLGVIGCGNVLDAYLPQATRLVARGLAEVTLACGRTNQRERALALGALAFTTDEAELLQHPGIDAVLVLASMPEHARLAAAAVLGAAIAHLVNTLDPDAVVLGGGLGLAHGLFHSTLVDSLHSHLWSHLSHSIPVLHARLGLDSGIVGAALGSIRS